MAFKQQQEDQNIEIDLEVLLNNPGQLPTGQVHKLDASLADDAWDFGAPPPKGHYDLSLALGKGKTGGVRYNKENENYSVGFECRVVNHENKDYNNAVVFAGVSTRIGRGKDISTAAALLVKMGVKIPNEATDLQIVQLWMELMKHEPICRQCLVDWKAGYKDERGDWQNKFNSMEDFPHSMVKNEKGENEVVYNHEPKLTTFDGGSVTVRAMLWVSEWGGANVNKIVHKKDVKGKGKATSVGSVKPVFTFQDSPTFLSEPKDGDVPPEVTKELDFEFMKD